LVSTFWSLLRRTAERTLPSDAASVLERARREFFIVSRLATAAIAFVFVIPFLVVNHQFHPWLPLAIIWVVAPLASVGWLLRKGSLVQAQFIWQAGLLTLAAITFNSGYGQGATLICLLLIPAEAAVSDALPIQLLASAAAATFMLIMFGAQYGGLATGAESYSNIATAALSAPAALYLAMLMVGAQQIHAVRQRGDDLRAMHYRVLADVIGDLVLRHDSSGAVISASGGVAQFALDRNEILGAGLFERVHVADRPAYIEAVDAAARRDGTFNVTVRLRKRQADIAQDDLAEAAYSWAEMRLHRLAIRPASADSDRAAIVSVVRNVSVAKAFEARLEAARAQAESASSWKDRLLANVSHELRTPLNAIIGFSEMLSREDLSPRDANKQREYSGIIHASAEHLLSVVNLILDMSKIEAGRFEIAPEPFELAPLIAACCDMVRLKATSGGVALIRAPLNCPAELIADKRAFRQVLINLLSNAVKFTRSGGRVTIGGETFGEMIHLSISDTGIGIDEGNLPRIGDPFFQVGSSYDRLFEGTGLGLSLVRGLVGLLGGSLLVESAPEVGTRVTVRLPIDCRGQPRVDGPAPRIETAPRLDSPAPARIETSNSPDMIQERKIA
jgi:two-component system, cell cycle sensor histidine kinase DivJ